MTTKKKQEIIVTINAEGNVKIETDGFSGKECYAATDVLIALGQKTTDVKKKEFYEEIPTVRRINITI